MSPSVAAAAAGPVNPPSFDALSNLLDQQPHTFALGAGSDALRLASEQALKDVFQIALDSEPSSLPPLESFLRELVLQNPSSSSDDALPALPPTPLDSLYTADLAPEQVWEQLELRASKLVDVLGQFGILADLDEADEDAGGGLSREEKIARGIALDSDEEEDDDEEDLSDSAFDGIDDMSDSEASGSEVDDDDDESPLSDPDAFDDSAFPSEEEDDFAGLDYGDDQAEEEEASEEDEEDDTHRRITDLDAPGSKRDARRSHPTLDDAFFSIDAFNRETEELEALDVTSGALGADESASEDEDEDDAAGLEMPGGDDNGMDDEDDDDEGDDEDDFEKLMSGGPPAPGGDIWAQAVDAGEGLGTDEVKYADFFAPPSKPPSGAAKRAHAKAQKAAKGGKGKAALRRREEADMEMDLDEDEMMEVSDEDDEDEDEGEEDDEEEDQEDDDEEDEEMEDGEEAGEEDEAFGARKGKTDLFADDDEPEETDAAPQSTHAKRLAALNAQIASLEAENAGPKQWALAGEASSRARPLNAVLEEDLEFDTVGKQVPLVTEEKVKNLEEKIKQRILENNYNDVERRRPLDAKPFLPSRVFELSDEKSTRSLAQIYEDEYTASSARAKGGKAPLGEKDAKLAKEHEEIEQAWDEICYKLDALSNANFTPKQPKAHIQSLSNTASISLESALPPTLRASTLLAPEEVFNPPSASDLVASSELTPSEKRARHGKDKKRRRKHRDQLEAMEGMAGQTGRKRVGTRQAKDEALKTLVKEGKGVTVIGKDAKKFDRQGRRQNANPSGSDRPADGSALKL